MRRLKVLGFLFSCLCVGLDAQRSQIDLDGSWQFQIDPQRLGESQGWHSRAAPLGSQIQVPGCWQAQGIGEARDYLRHDYTGLAWYRRGVEIPKQWSDKQVWLRFGGAIRQVEVFVNGTKVGTHRGFSAPFRMDVSRSVRAGEENLFAIAVDNSAGSQLFGPLVEHDYSRPVGALNYLGNWGGLYGHVSLEATTPIWIDEVHVRTRLRPRQARVHVRVASQPEVPSKRLNLALRIRPAQAQEPSYTAGATLTLSPRAAEVRELTVGMPEARLWSPEHPFLYQVEIELREGPQVLDRVLQTFGIRQIRTENGKLYLNGQPYYLRGFGDLSVEVLTGTPSVSLAENQHRVGVARDYGFNFVRLHSRIPPEEFFQAADEKGLLVHAELPAFNSRWLSPHVELPEIYRAFRNHPSWISSALGNELVLLPGKEKKFKQAYARFYREAKRWHPDHLVMATSGEPMEPSDYFAMYVGHSPDPRRPAIAHEFGGWLCSLPNLALTRRFTGVLEPYWTREEEWLRESGLWEIYPEIMKNSQRLLFLARKFRIEELRRNPRLQGYQQWLINDFPSGTHQGYLWEEGVLDFFWEPKVGSSGQWSQLNGATLLLTDADISQRTWWHGESSRIGIQVSHYGPRSLEKAHLLYSLEHEGNTLLEGSVPDLAVPRGEVTTLTNLQIPVPELGEAAACTLRVELRQGRTIVRNDWGFWAYPRDRLTASAVRVISRIPDRRLGRFYPFIRYEGPAQPGDLLILDRVDYCSFEEIRSGARALILARPNRPESGRKLIHDFFPTIARGPHANGTRVEDHPMFRRFPHEGFCDAQFYNLLDGAVVLSKRYYSCLAEIKPILWNLWASGQGLERQGYLFEFRVARGRVLATSLNIQKFLDEGYPSVLYLFDQMLRYATGREFSPGQEVPEEKFTRFVFNERP